jgi:hypothetical protein
MSTAVFNNPAGSHFLEASVTGRGHRVPSLNYTLAFALQLRENSADQKNFPPFTEPQISSPSSQQPAVPVPINPFHILNAVYLKELL